MKICFIENFSETNPEGFIKSLVSKGHKVTKDCDETYDIIFCASIAKLQEALSMKARFPRVKLVTYCWDYYKWAHDGKHKGFDWKRYVSFMQRCNAIIVPSHAQQLRLKELLNLDSYVVETGIEVYDYPATDERFVLDPVRYYPEENEKWVEKACDELGIKCIHSEHQYSKEDFKKLIHTCTFMTCAYREASTGGLTLIEGLWNGKPSLVSNSPYMGAKDYIGEFGTYFQYDDFQDLKSKIKEMFFNTPKIDVVKARKYISSKLTDEVMASKIEKICEHLLN